MNEQRFNYAQSGNRSNYSEEQRSEAINREKADEYVNRLQLRIVKAAESGRPS